MVGRLFGRGKDEAAVPEAISVGEVAAWLERDALLIDVREPDEWREGHAPEARHIPLGHLGGYLDELPQDRDLLLICRSGGRSDYAMRALRQAGFPRAINVAGGMLDWPGWVYGLWESERVRE